MFKRKNPRSLWKRGAELIWPSMGWPRAFRYMKFRLLRLSDTTHQLAAGLATGVSFSFSPILGTQFFQAMFVAYIARVNVLGSFIGTFFGNPWTFPFMWLASIKLGSYLFGLMGFPASSALPADADFSLLWEIAISQPQRILLPWMLGGYLIGLLSWPLSYGICYYLVSAARAAHEKTKIRKLHNAADDITRQGKQ
jgi:uncharacterized protein (DUF2062 family)